MILRGLYRMLLRLRPQEWRSEMLSVFEQARADARARGWLSHAAFGLRELAGLLSLERTVARVWPYALGGAMVGLLAGWVAAFWVPEVYVSRAVIRVVPSMVPERFAPGAPGLTSESLQQSQSVISRIALTNMAETYGLFQEERKRMTMEDAVELTRKSIEIGQADFQTLRVSFSYRDRFLAQKVTRDLMSRLVDETTIQRRAMSKITVEFLSGQAGRAASVWDELNLSARQAGPGSERSRMDVDLAKQRYVTLRQQLAEAEMMAALEESRQGPTVEVVDLPSLPENPELSHTTILSAAAAIGLMIGLLAGWIRRIRLTRAATPNMISAA